VGAPWARANTVCLGVVETPMTETIRGDRFIARMPAGIPLGRFSKPSEVAPTICFLRSDAAGYITDQYTSVDGGIHTSV
jgi:3-oxoacyl-[acyl-carrier protein] reductase